MAAVVSSAPSMHPLPHQHHNQSSFASLVQFANHLFPDSDPTKNFVMNKSFMNLPINPNISWCTSKSNRTVAGFVYPQFLDRMVQSTPQNFTFTAQSKISSPEQSPQDSPKDTQEGKEEYQKLINRVRKHRRCRVTKDIREGVCLWCKTTKTPEWRTGPNHSTLCNACGLQYRTNKKKEEIVAKKRNAISNLLN